MDEQFFMVDTMSSKQLNTRSRILEATWKLMEKTNGLGISMKSIAQEVGISRQALYLHFKNRTELMIATVNYVDNVKGLNERIKSFKDAKSGLDMLEAYVDIWGNYIPEIYGVAKALLNTRETDEASALAWESRMSGLRRLCEKTISALSKEGMLAEEWSEKEAVDMFSTMISIHSWEQLRIECGWTTEQYIKWMKATLTRTFVRVSKR